MRFIMPDMGNRDEPPHPPPPTPTPAVVLGWVAAAADGPWFPSQHAADTNTDRDALDAPLNLVRLAGLVKVAAWVRGRGQGYVLTPEGKAAAATGEGIPAPGQPPAPGPVAALSAIPEDRPAPVPFTPLPGIDHRRPLVVPALVIANVLWFFVAAVLALRLGEPLGQFLNHGNGPVAHRTGAVTGDDLIRGEWWRLASSCFAHLNLAHILMNMVALVMMGPLVELLWGRWRVAVIYTMSGLAGSCLAMALRPDVLLMGASGAIWGLMMAVVAWFVLYRDRLPPVLAANWGRRLLLVVLINGAASFLPGISWEGHFGGGLAGFVTAWLVNAVRVGKRPRRLAALGLLLLLPVACVGGLVAMKDRSERWAAARERPEIENRLKAEAEARTEAVRRHREAVAEFVARMKAAEAAREAYNRDVVPLLTRLGPDTLDAAQKRANVLLLRPGPRRDPMATADVRARLAALKGAADAAAAHLAAPPVGSEAIDARRTRAKAFADARSKSLELLLDMLGADAIPTEAAWDAWGAARKAADAAWADLNKP